MRYLTAQQDPLLMRTEKNWVVAGADSERRGLAFLICFHIVLCCVSLAYVSQYHDAFHIFYDPARLYVAIIVVAAFALGSYLFTRMNFSFGYFVVFYFYTMERRDLFLECF